MDVLVMVAQLVLSLSLLVILHECGHFFPARWFKTRVEKFYLFFDPGFSLLKFKKGDTEYGIGWLPLGGYVKISGMIDESFDKEQMAGPPQPWEFRTKKAWQRLIIMLGGVTVNFILSIIIFTGIAMYYGDEYIATDDAKYGIAVEDFGEKIGLKDGDHVLAVGGEDLLHFEPSEVVRRIIIDRAASIRVLRNGNELDIPVPDEMVGLLTKYENKDERLYNIRIPITVGEVIQGSEAERIGLQVDDRIIKLNGVPTLFFDQFTKEKENYKNKNAPITLIRGVDTINYMADFDSLGRLGFISFGPDKYFDISSKKYGLADGIVEGYDRSIGFITDQMKAFGQMFTGRLKASESVGSFISIGKMFGGVWNWQRFWSMTAALSALLGFINLLPIPGLDGGHVMFLLWEVITGRKPSDTVVEYGTMIGFLLIIALMIFAVGTDIMRHI